MKHAALPPSVPLCSMHQRTVRCHTQLNQYVNNYVHNKIQYDRWGIPFSEELWWQWLHQDWAEGSLRSAADIHSRSGRRTSFHGTDDTDPGTTPAALVATNTNSGSKLRKTAHHYYHHYYYIWHTVSYRDVKRSSNFRTLILKFEFKLHTFGIRSSYWNLDRDALPVSRTLRYELLI